MRYYVSENGTLGANMPFNFQLIYLENGFDARNIKGNIDFWLDNMPLGHTPNWVVCKAQTKCKDITMLHEKQIQLFARLVLMITDGLHPS